MSIGTTTWAGKAPFPWFGGKARAAGEVWAALGDVDHYVEPFAGSLAVLLGRPHRANRTYHSETVNDADGLLVNAWRSIALSPEATAEAASWPVAEADLHARHLALVRWREERELEHLMGDPAWHDPTMAGWWLWGIAAWIGSGWCTGRGAWVLGDDDHLTRRERPEPAGVTRQVPFVSGNGQGINHASLREPGDPGVARQVPFVANDGRGVHHGNLRESPGVARQVPNLGDDGRGVNSPKLRGPGPDDAPGVGRRKPMLVSDGQGVNAPQLREDPPGVARQLPMLASDGQGVNHPKLRADDPGVVRKVPHLGDDGRGVNRPQLRGDAAEELTMPRLAAWFRALAARLRHVRILNGDWARVLTPAVVEGLSVRAGAGVAGVFLDPPYGTSRQADVYAHDAGDEMTAAVQAWCLRWTDTPARRIVVAGFEGEYPDLVAAGWREVAWYTEGWLTGGMGNTGADGHQMRRERLWCSPHCLRPDEQLTLL